MEQFPNTLKAGLSDVGGRKVHAKTALQQKTRADGALATGRSCSIPDRTADRDSAYLPITGPRLRTLRPAEQRNIVAALGGAWTCGRCWNLRRSVRSSSTHTSTCSRAVENAITSGLTSRSKSRYAILMSS